MLCLSACLLQWLLDSMQDSSEYPEEPDPRCAIVSKYHMTLTKVGQLPVEVWWFHTQRREL